ncbi:T9SS type A sorting domain-containing protein [uncultured Algibacter sp.]|uniref:T9SS type A sorting domain-containing protein n=1 Tax=uncultured Algibacter sp. TaxID=298659 RepID=UPI00260ED499|nr:T9SS type A sorting domain-containing protein [uncultured Algibacter sp.]
MKLRCFIYLLFSFGILSGQTTAASSGGDLEGVGGSASYTVGQTVYQYNSSNNGDNLSEGVQQAFEVSEVLGITDPIGLDISVFPNPAASFINLKFVDNIFYSRWPEGLTIEIMDIRGKLIHRVKARKASTRIDIKNLDEATYFMNVLNKRSIIKTFKFVKYVY